MENAAAVQAAEHPAGQVAAPGTQLTVGQEFEGGIYAGLTIHENRPAHLILLPESVRGKTWKAAGAWAKEQGGELPSRIDGLALFQNLKDQFQTDDWYWTAAQFASDEPYAWAQDFDYGGQGFLPKGYDSRARAVRRLPI